MNRLRHRRSGGCDALGSGEVDRDPGGAAGIADGVDPRATVQSISSGVAGQLVGEGRATQILDVQETIALGIAAMARTREGSVAPAEEAE